jgi:hypothetical protein
MEVRNRHGGYGLWRGVPPFFVSVAAKGFARGSSVSVAGKGVTGAFLRQILGIFVSVANEGDEVLCLPHLRGIL